MDAYYIGGVMPTPIAISRASLSGFVHTTTCDPNEISEQFDGTNWTIGARGETEMRTVLSPIKLTVNTRPSASLLFETTMPFVTLVLVSAGVSRENILRAGQRPRVHCGINVCAAPR